MNVADQRQDADSLWSHIQRLIRYRRQSPELAFGELTILETEDVGVLIHALEVDGWAVVAVHNLGAEATSVTIDLRQLKTDEVEGLVDLLHGDEPEIERSTAKVDLDGFGYRWYRVRRTGDDRIV